MKRVVFAVLALILLQSCTKNDTPVPAPVTSTPVAVDTLTAGWQFKKIDSSGRSLADVLFLNATTGFACGESGALLKTTDGGNNWRQVSVPGGSLSCYNIQFVNSQYGFVAANSGILRTTDGGDTWSNVSTSSTTTDVFFTTPATGFYTSGTGFRKSVDSGKTWTAASSAITYCTSLWFVSLTKGFVSVPSTGLYKTTDATTFSTAFNSSMTGYSPVYFANAINGCTSFGTDLYVTNDGGTTWSMLKQFSSAIADVKNVNDQEYYVNTRSEIWHTTDKGITWTREAKIVSGKSLIEFTLGQPGHVWISAIGGYVCYK